MKTLDAFGRLGGGSAAYFLVACLLALPVRGQDLTVDGAWAREPPPGAAMTTVYLTIHNHGGDDLLRGASTDVAEAAELHAHVMEDSVMRMRRLEGIPVPADSTLKLKPGGMHIMLIGLEEALAAGESFAMTLHFDKAGAVRITPAVRPMAASAGSHGDHADH